jgi:hypothetical protein
MPFFHEGPNPQPRTPAANCYAFTFGLDLANGQTTPCTTQGQRAEYVYADTVDASPDGYKFAVGVFSLTHSGGTAVPCLAGGAVAVGHDVIVGMRDFTNNDGVTVSLPVAIDADDAEDGDWIVARATRGTSAPSIDTDINRPSLALLFYAIPMQYKGGVQTRTTLEFPIDLATVAATGDVVTDFPPGFAGTIIDHEFVVDEPVTTGGKSISLSLEINATPVTGGVVALTSANATPQGKHIAGTAVTANAAFDDNDTLTIRATVTAAFTEGTGTAIITVEQTPTP